MSHSFNTLCIGKVFIEKKTCTSTNDECKTLLTKSKPIEGTAIITDHQTAGRGQFGNTWQGEAGKNLLCSVVLYPTFLQPKEQFYLSKIVSLACVKTCETLTNETFQVKWPNDIYHNHQKVAGILIENQLSGNQINSSIVGVGFNVNQQNFDKLQNATSLINITQQTYDLKSVVEVFFNQLDAYYLQLRHKKFESINQEYFSKLLGYNSLMNFKDKEGNAFQGFVKGVNELGQLKLLVNNAEQLYNFKEVEWSL